MSQGESEDEPAGAWVDLWAEMRADSTHRHIHGADQFFSHRPEKQFPYAPLARCAKDHALDLLLADEGRDRLNHKPATNLIRALNTVLVELLSDLAQDGLCIAEDRLFGDKRPRFSWNERLWGNDMQQK